ncbi:hypothetical protein MP638_003153 [Amoeboaphelidium occidentale]|nr:hypothetical protein MP638_003153 [Amoeboaphelidium occidentale]
MIKRNNSQSPAINRKPMPSWDATNSDLSKYKLSPAEKKLKQIAAEKYTPTCYKENLQQSINAQRNSKLNETDWSTMKQVLLDILIDEFTQNGTSRAATDSKKLIQKEVDFSKELEDYNAKNPIKRAQPTPSKSDKEKRRLEFLRKKISQFGQLANADIPVEINDSISLLDACILTVDICTQNYVTQELETSRLKDQIEQLSSETKLLSEDMAEVTRMLSEMKSQERNDTHC